jgi:hypothetical protein
VERSNSAILFPNFYLKFYLGLEVDLKNLKYPDSFVVLEIIAI